MSRRTILYLAIGIPVGLASLCCVGFCGLGVIGRLSQTPEQRAQADAGMRAAQDRRAKERAQKQLEKEEAEKKRAAAAAEVKAAAAEAKAEMKAQAEKRAAELEQYGDKYSAYAIAVDYAKDQLKAPATAKFPLGSDKAVHLGDGKWEVHGHVDSENSFGAKVRTRWKVVAQKLSGDRWRVEQFDAE